MHSADTATRNAFLTLLLGSLALALAPVFFPALDFAASRYFLQANPPLKTAKWWWVDGLNEHIPMVFRSLAVACMIGWGVAARWRKFKQLGRILAFVGIALLLGPGLMVSGLKDLTTRARPHHVIEFQGTKQYSPVFKIANQCDDNCAFPSGHAADGMFIASLMLIDRRRRWWWLAGGIVGAAVVGFARVSVGAHWLSDVLWAFPVTLMASWVVYLLFERFYPEPAGELPL